MSFDKAIAHKKEKRKPYYGAKAVDATCRNGGSCAWCRENRLHKYKWREDICAQKMNEAKGDIRAMSELTYNLRKNIRKEMKNHNMTDQEFADALKYTADDMERLFSGELLLPPREIERIARLFGTTKHALLGLNKNANE